MGKNMYFGLFAVVVDFFFMLSGFLIVKSISKKQEEQEPSPAISMTASVRYAFHKAKSFYLPYILAFGMVFVLTVIISNMTDFGEIM